VRRWLLPAVSGLLIVAAYPRIGFGWAAWVALLPLGLSVARSRSVFAAARAGFIFGFVEQAFLLSWIPGVMGRYGGLPFAASWALFFLLIAVLSGLPAVACGAVRALGRDAGGAWILMLPFFWVAQEYVLAWAPFGGFPWLQMGYTQTEFTHLIQIADLTGVYGVSWLLAALAASIVYWLSLPREFRRAWPVLISSTLVAAAVMYGVMCAGRWGRPASEHTVAMLQANITMEEDESSREWKFREGYVAMAGEAAGKADLVLIPESPSPLLWDYDEGYRETMRAIARRFPMGMILSNIAFEGTGEGQRYYNSAFFVSGTGTDSGRYDKINLVPFGEYIPLRSVFRFVETVSKDVGSFTAGTAVVTVPVGGHSTGAVICFEAVFPQLCRKFVLQGGELLVNLTNDAWYGDTSAPHQHLAIARWRAVENRRYLLRAANSGVSAVIDPLGRVHGASRLFAREVATGQFEFIRHATPYTLHGDVAAVACAIISVLALAVCGLRSRWRAARAGRTREV
jgi:apolipoprotein N-acyltransferase